MNKYREMRDRHQKEFDSFPMFFAFNDKQFEEGMKRLGLQANETDKIYKMGVSGGFYRRSDAKAFRDLLDRQAKEMEDAIAADETGDGFAFDMFSYELANHEYGYTGELADTLDALGLTLKEIRADAKLTHALEKAIAAQWDE